MTLIKLNRQWIGQCFSVKDRADRWDFVTPTKSIVSKILEKDEDYIGTKREWLVFAFRNSVIFWKTLKRQKFRR